VGEGSLFDKHKTNIYNKPVQGRHFPVNLDVRFSNHNATLNVSKQLL